MAEPSRGQELLLLCLLADFHPLERQQSGPTAHTAGEKLLQREVGFVKHQTPPAVADPFHLASSAPAVHPL